jgi:hypothetical protein
VDWTTFFVVSAGASATLVGLLFIGVQINLERFGDDPTNPWSLLARSTYVIFALLFLGSLLFLMPSFFDALRGEILVGPSVSGIIRVVRSWRALRDFRRQFGARILMILIALPLAGYGLTVIGGAWLWIRHGTPDQARQMISLGFWFLYVVALRSSWNLLFDARQAPRATR